MITNARRCALAAVLLSALSMPAITAGESMILGSWELTRVDNLRPRDIPPYGFRNVVLVFEADGTFQNWTPGYAEPETSPYEIDGDRFTGWFGFSNDRHTPRKISFPNANRIELEFPDGAVASFRRIDDATDLLDEIDSDCVPFTARRVDYDPEFVASVKKKQDGWNDASAIPEQLLGDWVTVLGEEGEDQLFVELVLGEDRRAKMTRYFLGDDDISPEVSEGPFFVDGGWLSTPALSCGAAVRFELAGQELRMTPDGSNYFEFERAAEEN